MRPVALSSETDFPGWRRAARDLCARSIAPEAVSWNTPGGGNSMGLFRDAPCPRDDARRAHRDVRAPAKFLEAARRVSCVRDGERFARLYRILFRLQSHPRLLDHLSDTDTMWLRQCEKAIRRDVHKFHAFVRFRKAGADDNGRERFAAWFEPTHYTTELSAPFFMRRFPNMDWVIVTPDRTALWDGRALTYAAGGRASDVPQADAVEDHWRAYFSSIFNPARLKVRAMKAEMPMKYWRNLPEAQRIPGLIRDAEKRRRNMQNGEGR